MGRAVASQSAVKTGVHDKAKTKAAFDKLYARLDAKLSR
jgi:hypothetical protein